MHQQMIIAVLIGLAISAYGLDLSHAAKRSSELDSRTVKLITDLYTETITVPLSSIVTNLALVAAQIFVGISHNGIHAADGRILHPSDEQLRGFFSGLWNDALRPPLENALSGISLLAAQVLAGIGSNGVNLGIGKRDLTEEEMRGFFSGLWNDALRPPLENALSGISLLAAQVLAGIGSNGVNLGIGKRDLTEEEMRGFFSGLWNDALKPPLENALSGISLLAAQVLAGIGSNGINLGIGKRDLTEEEMRGFLDSLGQAVSEVFSNVIQKPLEDALAGGALMLAQALAGIGTNGVNLSGLLGKRDVIDLSGREEELRGILSTVGGAVLGGLAGVWNNIFQVPLENFVQNGALTAAGWLATLGTDGVNLG
ncbi:hypothetical protein I4U23_021168 [Adineta vaga]|nr:hypothetical protein I4U23_021168 [Adineta vaga]